MGFIPKESNPLSPQSPSSDPNPVTGPSVDKDSQLGDVGPSMEETVEEVKKDTTKKAKRPKVL